MLHLILLRKYRKEAYTIGQLYNGNTYLCNTVEDTDRGLHSNMAAAQIAKLKIKGQTAIPTGSYKVEVTDSPKFKRPLPLVLNVPGFSGIRIHRGQNANSTEGCIIPGENTVKGGVTNSTRYEEVITKLIQNAQKNNEECWLTII